MMAPDKQRDDDWLYTPDEAAQILRVSRRTIFRMGTAGEIEMIKLGPRTIRFTARSVKKWLKPEDVAR